MCMYVFEGRKSVTNMDAENLDLTYSRDFYFWGDPLGDSRAGEEIFGWEIWIIVYLEQQFYISLAAQVSTPACNRQRAARQDRQDDRDAHIYLLTKPVNFSTMDFSRAAEMMKNMSPEQMQNMQSMMK